MSELKNVEGKILTLWEEIAEARGFDRVLGRVLCTLLIEKKPLSQKELKERTGYSVPTISKTLKTLISLGTGRKKKEPGTRTTQYYVEIQPWELLSGALIKWINTAKVMKERTLELLQEVENLKTENPEQAEKLINMLRMFITSIPRMIEIMEKAIKEMQELKWSRTHRQHS
ncbi:MAG: GbsR/MarR family transcriptional regulator [Promethearchaeota archaeon]